MKTCPSNLADELLTSLENGNWSHVRQVLRDLAESNPDAALATAFYLGEYCQARSDAYTVGRLGRLLTDDVPNFDSPIA